MDYIIFSNQNPFGSMSQVGIVLENNLQALEGGNRKLEKRSTKADINLKFFSIL
jgi:hypothetical protein